MLPTSVIVPVGNREQYRDCRCSITTSIESAADCGLDWELVEVFDDDRKGVAWARNEGVHRASGDYVAWVDCDDQVQVRWAAAIVQGLKAGGADAPVDVLTFGAFFTVKTRSAPAERILFKLYRTAAIRSVGGETARISASRTENSTRRI